MLLKIRHRLKSTFDTLLHGGPTKVRRADIRPLTPEEVSEAQAFFPLEKFFVYGHARSGTTLLMRLLDAHPEIHCSRQAHFFSRPPYLSGLVADPDVAEWLQRGSVRWNRGVDLSPVVMRAAADFILEREARSHGARIVGDKSPNSINDGDAVRRTHPIYPDARIVYILRDGRDAVLSHRFQAFIDGRKHLKGEDFQILALFEKDPERFRGRDHSLFTEKGLREYARGWVRNLETTVLQGQSLFGEAFYSLRFEDLLANPMTEVVKIWTFLGSSADFTGREEAVNEVLGVNRDAAWQEQQAGELAAAIPKGQSGGWRAFFTERDRRIFHEIAGETLEKWGYPLE